ncbi:MAG: hypothetical protein WAV05_06095 [Anaerolineales bacterium]
MRTQFTILIILVCLSAILLAGCNSAISTVSTNNGLSTATKLALGTLRLEGTSQAVTAEQASELLTLWEGYQSLSDSDTSSQVELDALMKQIEAAMTTDQIKAIEAMDLTDQSVSETLSTPGGNDSSSAPASTPSTSVINQAGPAGGPGGAPSAGDGMGDILGGMTTQSMAAVTQAPAATAAQQVNPMLLKVLIQLLDTRSQAPG